MPPIDTETDPNEPKPGEQKPAGDDPPKHDDPDPGDLGEGGGDPDESGDDPHPLEPGGKRFNQVVARSKKAEAKQKELEAQLQEERENRIRLEEREKMRGESRTGAGSSGGGADPTKKIYTWAELETMIEEGKITRPQAQDYREKVVRLEARQESEQAVATFLDKREKTSKVMSELVKFKKLKPGIMDKTSDDRKKVEAQYTELVRDYGYPESEATELVATRMVFGNVDTLERAAKAADSANENREAFVETHGQAGRRPKGGDGEKTDPVKGLDARQREHYSRLIKRGIYENWDAVREELSWTRKKKKAS